MKKGRFIWIKGNTSNTTIVEKFQQSNKSIYEAKYIPKPLLIKMRQPMLMYMITDKNKM